MRPPPWKVGELARRSGLTVRTLHYYDEIGLLVPSHHTGSGHRLYAARDVERLQQVASLRGLGFSLEQVREALTDPEFSPAWVIGLHVARLDEQIEHLGRLKRRLETLEGMLARAGEASVDEFLNVIKEMTMFETYYSEEQLEMLRQRAQAVGPERIREVEQTAWPELIAQVRAEMDKGTDPTSPTVRSLAGRWRALVEEFTGGDPGIARSLQTMYQSESTIHGMDMAPMREMIDYIGQALAAPKPDA